MNQIYVRLIGRLTLITQENMLNQRVKGISVRTPLAAPFTVLTTRNYVTDTVNKRARNNNDQMLFVSPIRVFASFDGLKPRWMRIVTCIPICKVNYVQEDMWRMRKEL